MCYKIFPLKGCPLLTSFALCSYGKEGVKLSIEYKMKATCLEGQRNKIEESFVSDACGAIM